MALTKIPGELFSVGDLDISDVGTISLDAIEGDADSNTSITFSGSDVITIATGGSNRLTIGDGALSPVTDNQIDLGTSSLEFKDAYFDGTVTSDAFAGPLTGDVTGNVSGTAATVTGAAQSAITSLGTLTALTGGTGDLVWDTSTLVVDSSANAVGIGTTSPNECGFQAGSRVLTIAGQAADDFGVIELLSPDTTSSNRIGEIRFGNMDGTDTPVGMASVRSRREGADDASDLSFWTEATSASMSEKMTITSGGNVGIGITTPAGMLHVDGHTSSIASIFESNGNGDTVPVQLKVKANNGTTSTQGLYGNAGSASTDNTITLSLIHISEPTRPN